MINKMTKMSKFVSENDRDINDVKNEADVFDETVANGVKTENEEVPCLESDDVFDEALERKIEMDSPRRYSFDTVKYPIDDDVFYGWEQPCHKDVKNKSIPIAKCLNEDETDDVFEEEQEKSVGFNFTTGIKLEIDEDNDILYENLQKSVDLLANNLKQENDSEQVEDHLPMSNVNINNESSVADEQKQDVVSDIEHNRTRINEYGCRTCAFLAAHKVILENQSLQLGIEENAVNERCVANTNNNFDITRQLGVEGTKKANVKKANKKLEQDINLNKECVTNRQKLNIDDKQQKEIAKSVEMKSSMENILSKETNLNKIAQLPPKTMSNRIDTLKDAQSVQTKLGNGENGGQLIEKEIPQFGEKNIECDKNSEESFTEIRQNNTHLKTKIQDPKISLDMSKIDKLLEECAKNLFLKRKRKKRLLKRGISRSIKLNNTLKVCKKNANNQFFKKMRYREWKRYLLKHGLKNSYIRSFFTNVNKNKFSTSQFKRISGEKEPQAEVAFQNIQTEGVCSEEPVKKIVSNDARFIDEVNSKIKANERSIDIPDVSFELPALESTNNNNIPISKEAPQVFNKETETIHQNKVASFTDPKENEDKAVKTKISFNSVHSVMNPVVETPSPKTMPSNNIEYCCTECPFKVKNRTNFKIHLIEHGPNFSSGIISFLDLARNKALPRNQFGTSNNHTHDVNEKVGKTNDLCTREIHSGMRSEEGKSGIEDNANKSFQSCENDGCIESVDNQQSEILNTENNTIREQAEPIVTNDDAILENSENQSTEEQQAQRAETFLCDKNDANIKNVDTKSQKMERNPLQILTPNGVILESGGTKKRRSNTAPKRIKLEIKNGKIYCCDQCSYQSHNKKYFNNHIIIHSKDVIKCDLCDFITNHHRNMNNHMLVHLKPEEIKMHKCPYCPYQTKRRSDLHNHLVLHKKPEERRMFQCDKCPYQSKRKCNLRVHQVGHKSDDDAPLFSCAVCSFTTKKKCSLKTHMIVHKKVEETCWYKCEQCPYTTKYKSGLKRHGLVHKERDEIKTYDCTVCLYRAKCKSHLKSHLLIHKDPKEVMIHNCDYCSYKAIQKSNLLTHMLKHKNNKEIKWIKCAECPYKTKLKSNLLKHVNRVHK